MIRFDTLPPEVVQAMCTPMHLILESMPVHQVQGSSGIASKLASSGALFLGSLSAVNDTDLLRSNHISHLVQVMDAPWLPSIEKSEKNGLTCYRIDIVDSSSNDLKPHLEAVCNYIDKALKRGESVLVHCQQGVSRSAAVVIAYLIRNRGMSYDAAFAFLKRKRACIKPNPGFVKTLQEWDDAWRRPSITRRFTS